MNAFILNTLLLLLGSHDVFAFGLGRHREPEVNTASPPSTSSPTSTSTSAPVPTQSDSSCHGLGPRQIQDLTKPGYSLYGIAPAYQGIRSENFGSCTMAASMTTMSAYLNSRNLKPLPLGSSRFDLGTVHPWYKSGRRLKGGWDESVETNFNSCYHDLNINPDISSMGNCLTGLVSRNQCSAPPSSPEEALRTLANLNQASCVTETCKTPSVITAGTESLSNRRKFLQTIFNSPNPAHILPVSIAWDTGVADGDYEGQANHASAIIGRKLSAEGTCKILIRNSWSNRCAENKDYPKGECNDPGKTDDFWVDEADLLNHSESYSSYENNF